MPDEPKKKSHTGPESRPVQALLEELGKHLTQEQKISIYDVLEAASRNATRRDDGYRLICERLVSPPKDDDGKLGRKWNGFRKSMSASEVNIENGEATTPPPAPQMPLISPQPTPPAKVFAKDLVGAPANSLSAMLASGRAKLPMGEVIPIVREIPLPKAIDFERALKQALQLPEGLENMSVEMLPQSVFTAKFELCGKTYHYACALRREQDVPKNNSLWEQYGHLSLEHMMNNTRQHEGVADIKADEMGSILKGAIVRHFIKGRGFVMYCFPVGKPMQFKFWLKSSKLAERNPMAANAAPELFWVVDPAGVPHRANAFWHIAKDGVQNTVN